MTPYADARDVRVDVRASDVDITASPSAVRHVLDNLLRNAVEASPADAPRSGRAGARPRAWHPVAGAGAPFATGRAGGTGLGVAVWQRIARAEGGELAHRPGRRGDRRDVGDRAAMILSSIGHR